MSLGRLDPRVGSPTIASNPRNSRLADNKDSPGQALSAEGQRRAVPQDGLGLRRETVVGPVKNESRTQLQRRIAALDALDQHTDRRPALARVERKDDGAAEPTGKANRTSPTVSAR